MDSFLLSAQGLLTRGLAHLSTPIFLKHAVLQDSGMGRYPSPKLAAEIILTVKSFKIGPNIVFLK